MTLREIWGQDVESKVQSAHTALDGLTLANARELEPHLKGLLECRAKLNAILDNRGVIAPQSETVG